MKPITRVLLAAALALALPGVVSAAVVVTFTDPARYSETGFVRKDGPPAMKAIEEHLKKLGETHLPADQTVRIEIIDIDLAGEERVRHDGSEVRILQGRADFPSIRLRYTWERPNAPAQSGEETVKDMTYLQRTVPSTAAYAYEKRMLADWFVRRFAAGRK